MVLTDKTILMLASAGYPPRYHGGWSERNAKFAKHLPKYGWTPVVVATTAGNARAGVGDEKVIRVPDVLFSLRERFQSKTARDDSGGPGDHSQPTITPIRRLKRAVFELIDKWLVIPDWRVGWAILALGPSLRLLREREVDIIYSSSPPVSTHLLGLALKRITRKPWVVDIRDPWTFDALNKHLRHPGFRLSVEKSLERLCFAHADAIIANTPMAERRYKALYSDFSSKIRAIPNGYDSEEMARAAACLDQPSPWRAPDEGVYVISHVGDFYRFQLGDRIPHPLLNALKALLDEGVISPETCRIILVGKLSPAAVRRIAELGLDRLIETVGVVSHFDAVRLMLISDLLLLFDPPGDGTTYVRSKLYEYLGSGKPILGIVPEGASRELLERSGHGLLASPDDPEGIKLAIRKAIEHRDMPTMRTTFNPLSFDREKLTGELSSLLDKLVDETP
jgi:glycosyltransferase involved in cell wall biosynthesis